MIRAKTCPDCGKTAKSSSGLTRHIYQCPVALDRSCRRRVRDAQETEDDRDGAGNYRDSKGDNGIWEKEFNGSSAVLLVSLVMAGYKPGLTMAAGGSDVQWLTRG